MHPDYGNRNDGLAGGLWAYFSPVATQWYFPPGVRGKLRNLLHGNGCRIA
jgi:hypothetical protein